MAAPGAASNFIELLPVAFLPGGHGNKSVGTRLPCKVVGHSGSPLMSTAGLGHWMPIFLKRFTGVTTRHSQKTRGASGTWKNRLLPSDTILHKTLVNRFSS